MTEISPSVMSSCTSAGRGQVSGGGALVFEAGGMKFGERTSVLWLKILMAGVLAVVSGLMFVRAAH